MGQVQMWEVFEIPDFEWLLSSTSHTHSLNLVSTQSLVQSFHLNNFRKDLHKIGHHRSVTIIDKRQSWKLYNRYRVVNDLDEWSSIAIALDIRATRSHALSEAVRSTKARIVPMNIWTSVLLSGQYAVYATSNQSSNHLTVYKFTIEISKYRIRNISGHNVNRWGEDGRQEGVFGRTQNVPYNDTILGNE